MKNDINRFAFIETRLLWGGGLTARQLADAFSIARQNAQQVVGQYRQRHPDNIRRAGRKQVASNSFVPHYIRSGARDFLDYVRGQAMMAYYLDLPDWTDLPFHDVDHLLRGKLKDGVIREVLAALHRQRAVTLYYRAKTGARMRDFSPNHLIFARNRYHVRGFCHLRKRYLDFVLSRITYAESSGSEWVSCADDKDWNTHDTLCFKPNPELPQDAIDALTYDFPLDEEGVLKFVCRRAIASYVERELLAIDTFLQCSPWVRTA